MSTGANSTAARLVPTLRYRDIAAAVDWLCSAFGFKRVRVVSGVDGSIQQAHVAFGNDIIMLLPARDFGADAAAPDLAVAELQSCYFVVDDADHHHRNAKAFGAEILDIRQYDLGGRGYSCRDPEGHVWSFGTYNPRQRQFDPLQRKPRYDPWAARQPRSQQIGHALADAASSLRPKITLASLTTALATLVVSAATIGWLLGALPKPAESARSTQDSKLVSRLVDDGPGKIVDTPTPLATERAQAPERGQAKPLLFGTPVVLPRAPEEDKPAVLRTPQLAKEPAPEPAANQAGQQVSERTPEEAAKEAAEQAELEARQRAAKLAAAREAQRAAFEKERAAAAAAKEAVKEAPAKPNAPQQAAKADVAKDARQGPAKQADEATWDCPTDPVTGKVACQPRKKEPTVRAAEPTARASGTSRTGSAEPARAEPLRRAEPAGASGDQIWDCVPRPPEGKVVCHPIPNRP